MKLRSSHIVALLLILIGCVVVAAFVRQGGAGARTGTVRTDDFLQPIDEVRSQGKGSSETAGIVPSAEIDMAKTARLEFGAKEVDLGLIPRHGKSSGKVVVRNTGQMPLEINEVRTSCGCTMGSFKLKSVGMDGKELTTIPPGSEMDLDITVEPDLVKGFHSRKTLTLFSNDPVHPQQPIDVIANVDPEYTMEPDKIDFGTVQQGDSPEVRAIIRQTGDEPLEITAVQPGTGADKFANTTGGVPLYTMGLVKRPESEWKVPGKPEWEVTAKLSPMAHGGEFFDQFTVVSNLHRVEKVDFEVGGKVETFYTVDPTSLGARSAVSPGQTDVVSAHITAKAPITVQDISVTGSDLEVTQTAGPTPSEVDIHLNIAATAKPGLKSETVSFTIKGPERAVKHSMRAFASVQESAPKAQ